MANDDNGRDRLPFPQIDSDLVDYDAYEQRMARQYREEARQQHVRHQPVRQQQPAGRQAAHQQPAGGFVPATSASRRSSQSSRGTVRNAHAAAGPAGAGQYSRSSASYQNVKHGMSGGKKAAITIAVIALVAAIAFAVFYFIVRPMIYNAKTAEMQDQSRVSEMEALDNVLDKAPTSFNEPFTVLLLGSDAREDDPDMGARTDTIVLCRIDPSVNTISMMSIPRDTMVHIDGVGTCKINAAYFYGGASATVSAVKDLTGVEINYYAEINFEKLVGLIDALGGIDVHNDEVIDDPDAGDITIPEGDVHLTGDAALVFSRSRAYADGDYTRQRNQRKVIDAIIHKGLEANATDIKGVVDTSLNFIFTTMSADFIKDVADQIRHNNAYPITIYSANIPSQPAYINDVSYVIADTAGVHEMARIFMEGGDISQPIEVSSISTDIANAGGTQTNTSGTNIYEEYTYYEPPAAVQEQAYVPQQAEPQVYYEEPANTGGGAGAGAGGGADAGAGAGAGGGGGEAGAGGAN